MIRLAVKWVLAALIIWGWNVLNATLDTVDQFREEYRLYKVYKRQELERELKRKYCPACGCPCLLWRPENARG